MRKLLSNFISLGVSLSLTFCLGFILIFAESIQAQDKKGNTQTKAQKKEEEKASKAAKAAEVTKKVAEVTAANEKKLKAIAEACAAMKNAIATANISFGEYPYDENTLPSSPEDANKFETNCKAGTLSWTAIRKFAPAPDKDDIDTNYAINVSLAVLDLDMKRLTQEHGKVKLFTQGNPVSVTDNDINTKQIEWWIDLRASSFATSFVNNLRTLYANLKPS
jgi:hypothetical protein